VIRTLARPNGVLTDGNPTEAYGIGTVSTISAIVSKALAS
jgi:hypothetical protein